MKEAQKKLLLDIVKVAAVLILIAAIAGGLLGLVHHFTIIDQEEVMAKKLSEVYDSEAGFEAINVDMSSIADNAIMKNGKIISVNRPKDDSKTLIIVAEGNGAYKSTLQIITVVTDYKIKSIASYSNQETPGLGSKAFEDSYLNQFLNKDIHDAMFAFGSGDFGVSAVTGATKTSNAIKNALNCAVLYFNSFAETIFGGEGI